MRNQRLKAPVRGQKGFTLIEVLVVVVLIGIIAAGIAMTISQVMAVNSRTSSKMVALRQVQQAGDRVSKDVQQARTVEPTGDSGFPLTLRIPYWTTNATDDLEMRQHKVIFELVGDELRREYYTDDGSESPDFTTTVARYIDGDETSFGPGQQPGAYVLKVAATVGLYTETRDYEVKPRPDS